MADQAWKLPRLRETYRMEGTKQRRMQFLDVKFYPYAPPNEDPVFAIVGSHEIAICRCTNRKEKAFDILKWLKNDMGEDPDRKNLHSCAWSRDPATQNPLLCVGGVDGITKVVNVLTGKVEKTLIGHGAEILDLATSPLDPSIIASSAGDASIRLWNLDHPSVSPPCTVILAGSFGHRESVIAAAFHQSGRYMLSGAHDHAICVWTLPEPQDCRSPDTRTKVIEVTYPHFYTQALHSNYVDCVVFHGDLIISKACEEDKIVLWMVTGFDSNAEPPSPSAAPKSSTFAETRSGFLTDAQRARGEPGYQRLLEFATPRSDYFYMRFGLLDQPSLHPILVFANAMSDVYFWDFKRLEVGHSGSKDQSRQREPSRGDSRLRSESVGTSSASLALETSGVTAVSSSARGRDKNNISDPWTEIKAHQRTEIPKVFFQGRQACWSADGKWLLVVGDSGEDGLIALFTR